ncbi:TonB-dependent siderophore receptor [Marinibactrum halimedae]|uniref:Ligand-gated channel protein n=1 Tax=Marinibactrum halimedae TaxID=1444977 RepID=A0AA37T6J4_9GAMM|nr:TonB-dependent siderophore receptor [Marinibactrum halimedae]MCD9460812.1 TonB-dependent siderophore receptor [Marinibactrum halimedae]GLS26724.1 ligand-gated channel protein [Marinibactrum halimedae]
MKTLPIVTAISTILGASLSPAFADQLPSKTTPKDSEDIEEVAVYGSNYRTTGTKSTLKPLDAPMSFEVYDATLLSSRQVDSVNDAMRYVPGVTPESRGAVTIFDQYSIRGFVSYFNYYEGLPLQELPGWNLKPQVDMIATETIEVLKGPTSVLYGAAPAGGMINQTAKHPQSTPETTLRARLGNNDLMDASIDSTGALSENVDYRLIALARQRDGQQVTTEEERYLLSPSITWQVADTTSLYVSLFYQDDPQMVPSTPLPSIGTLYEASYGRLGSDAYSGDRNWAKFDREMTMVSYKLNHDFSDTLSFLQNFRYTKGESLQHNTYNAGLVTNFPGLEDNIHLIRSAYLTDEELEGFTVDNQLAFTLNTGELEHRLLVGLDYKTLDGTVTYRDTLAGDPVTRLPFIPTIDLSNPDYDLLNPSTLPLDNYGEDHDIEETQIGFYIQDEIHWNAVTVIAGLRYDNYESTDKEETIYFGSESEDTADIDQDNLSARLAVIVDIADGVSPYINYSESFEPEAGFNDVTGEEFDPTTASQIEAGVKFQSHDKAFDMTFAVYDIRKEDVVVNSPTNRNLSTQAGEIRSQGAEIAANAAITENFSLNVTASYNDIEVTDNPLDPAREGKTPVWASDWQAGAWASYQATPALLLSGGLRHVGESALDQYNTDTVPSYTLWDFVASYQVNNTLSLGISASNLTDEEYVGSCFDASNCWMGAQRNVEFSVDLTF